MLANREYYEEDQLPPLPPPPGPPPGPPSVSPPLEPRILQVNGFALNFQETENNNTDTRNNNTRNNNGIYEANSTAYQNNEIVRDSLILYNETNNRQKLTDFSNRDINDRAEEVLRHIKSHREELNENLTNLFRMVQKDFFMKGILQWKFISDV